MTAEEATSLTQRLPDEATDFVHLGPDIPVHDGPLTVDTFVGGRVIGDLTCTGLLEIGEGKLLFVTGNLTAKNIIAAGTIVVLGTLEALDIVGDSFCNRIFVCAGDAKVRSVIEKGHQFEFEGTLTAELAASLSNVLNAKNVVSAHDFSRSMPDAKRHELLVPEVFDAEGKVTSRLLFARLHAGLPVLKASAP